MYFKQHNFVFPDLDAKKARMATWTDTGWRPASCRCPLCTQMAVTEGLLATPFPPPSKYTHVHMCAFLNLLVIDKQITGSMHGTPHPDFSHKDPDVCLYHFAFPSAMNEGSCQPPWLYLAFNVTVPQCLLFRFFNTYFLFHVNECFACMYVCIHGYAWCLSRLSGPLELEFWTAVSRHAGTGHRTRGLCKSNQCS